MIFTASVLTNIQTGMIILSHVFVAEVPPHYCSFNSTHMIEEIILGNGSLFAGCDDHINPSTTNKTHTCTNGWVYDTEVTGQSIVSDWDLICDKDYLPGLSQSFLLAGIGFGSVFGGPLADIYGRRPTFIIALILFNASGLLVSFAPNLAVFITLRFLMGAVFKSVRIPLVNLMYEFLLPKHRAVIGLFPVMTIVLGYIIMTGFAYYLRGWRYFHLLIMSPCVILMPFAWCIPESVRWILSQGDIEKAEKAMQKVAKFNKAVDFPNPAFSTTYPSREGNQNVPSSKPKENTSDSTLQESKTKHQTTLRAVSQLFKQPVLTVTFVLSFGWISLTMIYFGFALSSGSFSGDPYLNFLIISVADIPVILPAILLIKKVGNLKPLFFGFLGAGVTMVAIAVLPYLVEGGASLGKVLTALAVLGKFCLGMAAPGLLLFQAELFPTTIRNSGTAVVQLIGSVGSLSSPLLLYLNKLFHGLAFLIMAIFAFIAMVIALFLPDTRNTIQPETPADVQTMFDQKWRLRLGRRKQTRDQNIAFEDNIVQLERFDKVNHL